MNLTSSSTKLGLGAASVALAAGAVVAGTVSGGAQAASVDHPVISASATPDGATPNTAGRVGWQGAYTYSLPAGSGGVFFHYACPSGLIARSGGFDVNAAGQPGVKLVANSPWQAQGYSEFYQTLLWPGGAPSGVQITFDVYCTKKPA